MSRAHVESLDELHQPIGRHPDRMTGEELASIGHQKRPLLAAIRDKCMDCVGQNRAEVRRCAAYTCALWPYRMRSNPFHGGRNTDAAEGSEA